MIIIRFPDDAAKRHALGFLAGRFSFKSWSTGEMMVPPGALGALAVSGMRSKWKAPRIMSSLQRRYEILLPLQTYRDELVRAFSNEG